MRLEIFPECELFGKTEPVCYFLNLKVGVHQQVLGLTDSEQMDPLHRGVSRMLADKRRKVSHRECRFSRIRGHGSAFGKVLCKRLHETHEDPMEIVTVKGFGSGLGALCIALSLGEAFPMWRHLVILLLLGFVAYGLSIFFYTHAQRGIGAAKTSTYYTLAPFIGAFLSVVSLGEPIGWIFIVATIVMAAGCWLAGK